MDDLDKDINLEFINACLRARAISDKKFLDDKDFLEVMKAAYLTGFLEGKGDKEKEMEPLRKFAQDALSRYDSNIDSLVKLAMSLGLVDDKEEPTDYWRK